MQEKQQEKQSFACKPHFEWTPFHLSLRQHLLYSEPITQQVIRFMIWKRNQSHSQSPQ